MLSSIDLSLNDELRNREFRHEFYITRTQDEIASQIKDLRVERNMTQSDLAVACDMKQSAISRLEDADYSGWSFKSLSRIAKALDAQLQVLFIPMEKVLAERISDARSKPSISMVSSTLINCRLIPTEQVEQKGVFAVWSEGNKKNSPHYNKPYELGNIK